MSHETLLALKCPVESYLQKRHDEMILFGDQVQFEYSGFMRVFHEIAQS